MRSTTTIGFVLSLLLTNACNTQVENNVPEGVKLPAGLISVKSNIHYGIHPNQQLDLYLPENSQRNPLVLITPSPGKSKESCQQVCEELANRGIAAAAVNCLSYDMLPEEVNANTYRLVHGMANLKAATRYFKRYQGRFNIDTTTIYLSGVKQGATIASKTALLTNIDQIKQWGGNEMVALVNLYGGIDGNRGNPGYSSRVNGFLPLEQLQDYQNGKVDKTNPIYPEFLTAESVAEFPENAFLK
jgi:hypothetical protein